MKTFRREFLKISGMAAFAGMTSNFFSCSNSSGENVQGYSAVKTALRKGSLANVREGFALDPRLIHMSCLLLASHPKPVQDAIDKFRKGLNENPVDYVHERFGPLPREIRREASTYMNVEPDEIAITDSTTLGTGLLINGIHIRPGQEMLTATLDYHSTHQAIEFKAFRTGASFRKFSLYKSIYEVTEDEIVDTLIGEIRLETRLVTGTWVHSSTGLKIPVRRIADRLAEINAGRSPEDRVLFFVDGVHGFGVESEAVGDLGCDFFSAGTHKWMFGPRGTGILWGRSDVHRHVTPTIPTFTNGSGWGGAMSPGGFKPFEHQWAMAEAFRFHQKLGKENVQGHIHTLARQLKEGLSKMNHVVLYTPMAENLSSGIVCFDIKGMTPTTVVHRLARKNIIASDTPYATSYARLTPGIYNTSEEVETVLRAVREIV